jgi:peptidoglycan hydrolase CwlO-like protein
MPTQIGELFYEEGFRFQGNMNIGEFKAEFLFVLDYTKGFRIFAQMDEINIENIFIISGSGVQPKPTIDVNLMVGENPGIEIAGSIYLLGISSQVYININDTGFEFLIEGKIFNLFEASIQASGGNLKGGGDFYLKVQMRNDLVSFLREEAVKAIQNAAKEATSKINDAQNDIQYARSKIASIQQEIDKTRGDIVNERAKNTRAVESAQREVTNVENAVRELDTKIANMRNTVKAERARDTKKVKDAENAVTALQTKVRGLDTNIANMRAAITRERASDTQKLIAAQNEMTKAQRSVDSLQREINSSYSRINELRANINSKKKWYDNSPWYKKSYRWAEYSAYAAAKGAEITALYTKIGGIEAAKVTAKGGLEAAKLVVKGIERGINTFPIDSDPRIVSLFTAKEAANLSLAAANATLKAARSVMTALPVDADPRIVALFAGKTTTLGTLEIAKQTLRTAKALINTFPIDADPRILALFTAKESANASLIIANEFLEGIENAVGGIATVSTFIVEKGLGGLLDVKKAMFEGQLNAVKGGRVALALSLELMGKPHDLMLAFNFHSPLSGAKELGDKLLKMID